MSRVTVRLADARDLDAIRGIAAATELFPPEMLDQIAAPYLTGSAADIWLVAEADTVIGFAFAEPERMTDGTWNLLALAVDPTRQGTGAGRALVAAAEARLIGAGAHLLLVETMDVPDFASQREFYQRLGYAEEARIRDFYGKGAGKVVFAKRPDGSAAA